jgi:hypothetical protein
LSAVLEGHPVQKFHDDEWLATVLADLVNGANVRVVQGRCRLRLSLETGQRLGVFCNLIRQELQCNKSAQGYVFRLIHHTHAAAAQLLKDAVVGDSLADKLGGGGHCGKW